MLDWENLKELKTPRGNVVKVARAGEVLWEKKKAYTNLADPTSPDWLVDYRVNSSGGVSAQAGYTTTNWMTCKKGDTLITNFNLQLHGQRLVMTDENGKLLGLGVYYLSNKNSVYPALSSVNEQIKYDPITNTSRYVIGMDSAGNVTGADKMLIRFAFGTDARPHDEIIITLNEDIV